MSHVQSPPPADYIMGRTDSEYERLRQQAHMWEEATLQAFDRVGLGAGMSCLDIGCGPGETMRLMGSRVGKSGRVTGIDLDARIGELALARLRELHTSHFEFHHGDFEKLDRLSDAGFDLVYGRIVFTHMHDRVAAIKKAFSWVKPGGYLLVQEYDFSAFAVYPPHEEIAEMAKCFFGVAEKVGVDTRLGMRMPWYFDQAGIGDPDGTHVAGQLSSLDTRRDFMIAAYRSVLPLALRLGLTTEARSQRYFDRMQNKPADEGYHAFMAPLLLATWKRRPI